MKSDLKKKAIDLRVNERLSLKDIAANLRLSLSTVSLWLRDYRLDEAELKERVYGSRLPANWENDLRDAAAKGLSPREISAMLGRSRSSVERWLARYEIQYHTSVESIPDGFRKCVRCKIVNSISTFTKSNVCKKCNAEYSANYRRENKLKAIEYKGGKCAVCGYSGSPAAFDFHHLDSSQKDFSIGTKTQAKFESIKQELDKCILLCCRCHRELHDGWINIPSYGDS